MKKIVLTVAVLLFSTQAAWSGPDHGQAGPEAVKAEFAKCMMCKNFLPVFDELMPVMQNELVQLDSGMLMMHTVSDPAKVKLLHQVHQKLEETAGTAMQLPESDAKKQLCPMCQGMWQLVQAGAQVSSGMTKSGGIVVVTSTDPAVQKQIATYKMHCETMMAGGH